MVLSKGIELILTMLAKATPTKLHQDRDSQGFNPLKKDAQGNAVAGRTRKDIEAQTGKPVISGENFKSAPENGRIYKVGIIDHGKITSTIKSFQCQTTEKNCSRLLFTQNRFEISSQKEFWPYPCHILGHC